mgnify:CR=1 FL=1
MITRFLTALLLIPVLTGCTAEQKDRHGQVAEYVGSFACFGPVEAPRLAVLMVVCDPEGSPYCESVRVPVRPPASGQIATYNPGCCSLPALAWWWPANPSTAGPSP